MKYSFTALGTSEHLSRMLVKGGEKILLSKLSRKAFKKYPDLLQKYGENKRQKVRKTLKSSKYLVNLNKYIMVFN